MSLETGHQHPRLQKSQSFGYNTSSGVTSVQSRADKAVKSRSSSREDLVRDQKMFQRQKHGVDPLASLPTSHSRQYHRTFSGDSPPPPPHSPSPSQSEYDTCDPWDDY